MQLSQASWACVPQLRYRGTGVRYSTAPPRERAALGFRLGFGRVLATGPVRKAPERPWDSFGPILEAWRPFSIHFGPFW